MDELKQEVAAGNLLKNHDPKRIDDYIKRGSIDLTIGNIFVPEKKPHEAGGVKRPRQALSLNQGETALIVTAESLTLSDGRIGMASLPASLSTRGALATNPGMVDPGWNGELHVTIINMSNEPLLLKKGDRVLRVIVFDVGYRISGAYSGAKTDMRGVLETLSTDFMNFSGRIKAEVARQDVRGRWFQAAVPIIVAIGGALVAYLSVVKSTNDKIEQLASQIDDLKLQSKYQSSYQQINDSVISLKQRVDALDRKLPARNVASHGGTPK
ncbi:MULTISPECIES: dCTP deaminase domain-containing protein [unclassified Burkholderia]|uniref:dCTP deaminase domain-containing protein n=1 Tax=unclassified Burkholderia TaxID=2613784 RepID=UPI001624DD9F|nr:MULTISPECIES: hypothetical protein [unclassified Burkholderia]